MSLGLCYCSIWFTIFVSVFISFMRTIRTNIISISFNSTIRKPNWLQICFCVNLGPSDFIPINFNKMFCLYNHFIESEIISSDFVAISIVKLLF